MFSNNKINLDSQKTNNSIEKIKHVDNPKLFQRAQIHTTLPKYFCTKIASWAFCFVIKQERLPKAITDI